MVSSGSRVRRGAAGFVLCLVAGVLIPGVSDAVPKPHVWLHYDYLVYPDGRSEAPNPSAIQDVVEAYAAHGVLLEIDPDHTAIPTSNPVVDLDTTDAPCAGSLSFKDLKEKYFRNRSPHDRHYVIFAGDVTTSAGACPAGGISGIAELPGDDFVIAMNALRSHGSFKEIRERHATAGTFMHELGHNLGLRHGGNDDHNGKPNHISVMNYNYQFARIFSIGPDGRVGVRVDYSTGVEGAVLDSSHLDETAGLGVDMDDFTRFLVTCDVCSFAVGSGPARGPIDWNGNGDETESDVEVTFIDAGTGAPLPRFLSGFDEWSAIRTSLTLPSMKTKSVVHKDAMRPAH